MFQRLLVPLDGSSLAERAIPVAARLARSSGGTIILLYVARLHVDYGPYLAQASAYSQTILKTEVAAAYQYLERLARREDLAGITVLSEVLPGIPTQTIFAAVRFHHVDLIVLCSHGYTGIKRWIQGSVAHQLTRHSPVPVLVLRERGSALMASAREVAHPLRVVVALDGSSFAQDAIVPGTQLVAALNPPPAQRILHLVQVVKSLPLDEMRGYEPHGLDSDLREQAVNEARNYLRAVAETSTRQLCSQLGVQITWSVAEGQDVAETLLSIATRGEMTDTSETHDVIVLATHGREGFQRWTVGSVTERVLDATRLPLLIVHPQKDHQPDQREFAEEELWREKV